MWFCYAKVKEIPALLSKYGGKEHKLLEAIEQKYNEELQIAKYFKPRGI